MRESKNFKDRSVSDHSRKVVNYFLFFEGQETEVKYFTCLKDNAINIGLSRFIEIRPMMRSCKEDGCSNPKTIVDLVVGYIDELNSNQRSYYFIINTITDILVDNKYIKTDDSTKYFKKLECYCKENYGYNVFNSYTSPENKDLFIEKTIKFIKQELDILDLSFNKYDIIDALFNIKYNASRDKVCIIVDRDKDSFVVNDRVNQYDYVIKTCNKKKYNLYITNPSFEFWLYLHVNDAKNINYEKWLSNKNNYAVNELIKECPFFTDKSNFNAQEFINRIDIAVNNEKLYCEDIKQLENKLGSNIGLLITELRNKPNDT